MVTHEPPTTCTGRAAAASVTPPSPAAPRAKVFQSPLYIQQVGALSCIGAHVASAFPRGGQRAALITSPRLKSRYLQTLLASIREPVVLEFSGECSRSNVARLVAALQDAGSSGGAAVDHVIGFGAGKLLDVTKMVAAQLALPMVLVPSLASTDAPCLAVSIVYTDGGEYEGCEFLCRSPDLVVVDPRVVVEAPVEYLVAGMGDAMATQYEAAACAANPNAYTWLAPLTRRPPLIAAAIGRVCLDTLFAHGAQAKADCAAGVVSEALEAVVEANTLLSGLGVECGGLALAHGFHNALTALPEVHGRMHGEKVAFGTLVQLMAEGRPDEAARVAAFNRAVGLPTCLAELGVGQKGQPPDEAKLALLVERSLVPGSISWNLGPHLTPQLVRDAILAADTLGSRL